MNNTHQDNDNSLSLDEKLAEFYGDKHFFVAATLCCFGLATNVLMVAVLTRPTMRSTSNRMLTCIAVCDSLLMAIQLPYLVHFEMRTIKGPKCWAGTFSKPWAIYTVAYAISSVLLRASSLWISAAMAVWRRFAVRSLTIVVVGPLMVATPTQSIGLLLQEQWHTGYYLVACTMAFVSVISVPFYLQLAIYQENVTEHRSQRDCPPIIYRVDASALAQANDEFLLHISYWVNGLLMKLMPCFILAIFIASLVHFLWMHNRVRRQRFRMARANTSQRRMANAHPRTIILTIILTGTLLFETPHAVVSLLSAVKRRDSIYRNLAPIFDDLALIACTTSFPLYCLMSSTFQQALKTMLGCRQPQFLDGSTSVVLRMRLRRQSTAATKSYFDPVELTPALE